MFLFSSKMFFRSGKNEIFLSIKALRTEWVAYMSNIATWQRPKITEVKADAVKYPKALISTCLFTYAKDPPSWQKTRMGASGRHNKKLSFRMPTKQTFIPTSGGR